MKFLVVLLITFSISSSFSQQKRFKITGNVISVSENLPLESATVHLEKIKDSTVITYTITDTNGSFLLENKTYETSAKLYVSFVGYKAFSKVISFDDAEVDLGKIELEVSNSLDEVIINSTPPITVKKDTLEFNVKSFVTRKDASVEELLKVLPGIVIDSDGAIEINGKKVNKILVNGKPFFGNDPTITTRNLRKDMIEKVQVVDTKTKSQAFSNEVVNGNTKTINLTIKKENNKGVFGQLTAGLGTDQRFELAGIVNRFNNNNRISILAGGNNLNSPGFSVSNSLKTNAGNGITTSKNAGLNFSNQLAKTTDLSGNYFYASSNTENERRSNRENILPDSRYFSNSLFSSVTDNSSHSATADFEFVIDSTLLINVAPSFKNSLSKSGLTNIDQTFDNNRMLTNDSEANSFNDQKTTNFSNQITTTKKFGSNGAFLHLEVSTDINKSNTDGTLFSETNLYERGGSAAEPLIANTILRDQRIDGNILTTVINSEIKYSLPIVANTFFINFNYNYSRDLTEEEKSTFDKNEVTGEFNLFNTELSTDFTYFNQELSPGLSLSYKSTRLSGTIGLDYVYRNFKNEDALRPLLSLERNFEALELFSNVNYRMNNKSLIQFNYSLRNNPPELNQLQAFNDVSNPLNTITGNPNLSPTNMHSASVGYNIFNFQKGSSFRTNVNFNISNNNIITKSIIDDDLIRTSTYENIDGNYSLGMQLNYDKDIKIDSLRRVKISLGTSANKSQTINFNNGIEYSSIVNSISPTVAIKFSWKDVLDLQPKYQITYTTNKYELLNLEDQSFLYHNLELETGFFLPKNFEWRNTIVFNYNPNISSGFQKGAWFWNSTMSYSLLKDKAAISLKVYDILNQNTNARRTANENFIEDSQSTVLTQYVMLGFSFKLNSLGLNADTGQRTKIRI